MRKFLCCLIALLSFLMFFGCAREPETSGDGSLSGSTDTITSEEFFEIIDKARDKGSALDGYSVTLDAMGADDDGAFSGKFEFADGNFKAKFNLRGSTRTAYYIDRGENTDHDYTFFEISDAGTRGEFYTHKQVSEFVSREYLMMPYFVLDGIKELVEDTEAITKRKEGSGTVCSFISDAIPASKITLKFDNKGYLLGYNMDILENKEMYMTVKYTLIKPVFTIPAELL